MRAAASPPARGAGGRGWGRWTVIGAAPLRAMAKRGSRLVAILVLLAANLSSSAINGAGVHVAPHAARPPPTPDQIQAAERLKNEAGKQFVQSHANKKKKAAPACTCLGQ